MKIFIIIIFLLFSTLNADFASESLIDKVEKKYNKFAKNRFIALNKLLEKIKNEDVQTKLEKVNDFFNNVKYSSDQKIYGVSDYWATPIEFLARDEGDCEDYVIAKYFALEYLGVPTSKMFLSYVKVKKSNEAHMVLSYFETPTSEPIILDSLKKVILPASKRDDLTPVFNFNPNILKGNKTAAHKKWDTLIQNYKEQKL
ncbi:transglutaminase-like cysteine peptidase [Aliarcobacter butzleri]|jgi:predicted transglutaminase-like cysteine proteinase|uniref:transglutaminase-like cysteine peptidase n=1 Tax=Aliarcobacter butzleri TaxID=28197 RepID=UPI00102D6D5F|nr:transglutaminase-like cysteine peptidase [Aliarcobacter butzleri]MCG3655327.1 transglutaminase-like cysteine peptidase [Aliarcobacter butzleri]MCG3676843.1 transglutaminase-like cysteine peptidase [Aliarcobacter butzleri]MCG3677729.1 transglutaminase-like cysteine peptidase [Aliarcobacter butzleri]MCG3682623.1 transglutaminase-like cysteine peptidase [Aliarcobacter butzleri]MCG3687239.1 transglutaminase-like cysteine peptidase [Aliarcobacter butzleri]